ncbi:ATP-dependent DNA ligase LigC [Agrococcus casei LMG 22410]|uniref:ATP-dependent DNA ligase LigC n=1 Tax=Agrococcus casei LMG 22410 TaxID=1255656 RepID=A0A1R4FHT6_9MICO|nr:ATP-dependent DNA ligase LigC [Agrococcus casei LMG 22410]
MPAGLSPPFEVALARPVSSFLHPVSLPGGVLYEPKWDGFRLVIVRDEDVSLWSRQGKDLTRYFPELIAAAELLPEGVIVDGEAVVWSDGKLDFDALLRRMNSRPSTVARLAREQPASYAAFDVLAVAHQDTRPLPLRDRRSLLTELAGEWQPPLHLSPVTEDETEAGEWFATLVQSGIEGLVAKGAGQPYRGGERDWLKLKHRSTRDVICAAVIGTRERPEQLVLGLPAGEELRIVGRTSPLAPATARTLGKLLRELDGAHPWPGQVKPGAIDRFNRGGRAAVDLTLVDPIVVEISADVAMTGGSFRHAVRFVRARPDLELAEVAADAFDT